MINYLVYDIECYPNIFTITLYDVVTDQYFQYEVSWRCNHLAALLTALEYWQTNDYVMPGYNNQGYDYPLLHELMTNPAMYRNAWDIYCVGARIIATPWERRRDNIVPAWLAKIPQLDLMLIHHFDKKGESVSLKELEFKMRLSAIEDLPFEPAKPIPETDDAANTLLKYNKYDVRATHMFFVESKEEIELRTTLTAKYGKDFTNMSRSSIGKEVVVLELESFNFQCYVNKKPKQTFRDSIALGDVIFDYIRFETPELIAVYNQIKETVVTETKGGFSLKFDIDNVEYSLALGGIHASVKGEVYNSTENLIIKDADVTSFYPKLGIVNKISPAHIPTETFNNTVESLFIQRTMYPKKTHPVENNAIKIIINAIYGLTNDVYSPILDPLYTMTITVNGQLLLLMLIEQLKVNIPGLKLIQANTDGVTVTYDRKYNGHYDAVCQWWEQLTLLNLEYVEYSKMAVRDVNNYIAVGVDESIKYKGTYNFKKLEWVKDHSSLVVSLAASKAILEGVPVRQTILNHPDIYDFFKLAKVNRSSNLQLRHDVYWDGQLVFKNQLYRPIQRTSRYLVTNTGHSLVKEMPAVLRKTNKVDMYLPGWKGKKLSGGLNKNLKVESVHEYNNAVKLGYKTKDGGNYTKGNNRLMGIDKDYLVTIYNNVSDSDIYDINYDYYITEAEKLVNGVLGLR